MYKLKLKKALSYSGIVAADKKNPFVEVETERVANDAVATGYFDIVEFPEELDPVTPLGIDDEDYTAASLKKLNADRQKEIILELGGDLESVSNEEERIALILQLQEEQKVEKE